MVCYTHNLLIDPAHAHPTAHLLSAVVMYVYKLLYAILFGDTARSRV